MQPPGLGQRRRRIDRGVPGGIFRSAETIGQGVMTCRHATLAEGSQEPRGPNVKIWAGLNPGGAGGTWSKLRVTGGPTPGATQEPLRGESTMKIVVLDGRPMFADRAAWSGLDRLGEVELYQASSAEEVPARASGAEMLVTNKAPIRADLIDAFRVLRFITVTATGFDCVDIAAARERGHPGLERAGLWHALRRPVRVRAGPGALPPRQPARPGRPGR